MSANTVQSQREKGKYIKIIANFLNGARLSRRAGKPVYGDVLICLLELHSSCMCESPAERDNSLDAPCELGPTQIRHRNNATEG